MIIKPDGFVGYPKLPTSSNYFHQWRIGMYAQFRNSILVSSIALALGANCTPIIAQTVSQEVTDARQETQIWTTYALSPYLRASDLKVSVHSGKATLTGKVEEDVNKELAKEIALGVNGIKEVDNQIITESDYKAPEQSAARSYGEGIDDTAITAAIKSKLLWSKDANGMAADVNTKRGKVTLVGTTDSTASKMLAGRLAMNTRGVVAVDNQLTVRKTKPTAAETTKNSAQGVGQEVADSWITAKVKSTYAYSSNVEGSDISVSTTGGVVSLSGIVDGGAQRALAIELAQNVRGVKGVQSASLTAK